MKAKRSLLFTTIAILMLISSCAVISFYPIYTDDVLTKDDRIIGKWSTIEEFGLQPNEKDTLVWEISFKDKKWVTTHNSPFDKKKVQETNRYSYTLSLHYHSSPEEKAEFQLHLVKLGDKTYVDFYPVEWDIDNTILSFHLMGVHTFAKAEINEDFININWFDSEWFEQKMEENRIRIKHEKNKNNILLTAKPKDLQKFVIKYSDNDQAFDNESIVELKPFR